MKNNYSFEFAIAKWNKYLDKADAFRENFDKEEGLSLAYVLSAVCFEPTAMPVALLPFLILLAKACYDSNKLINESIGLFNGYYTKPIKLQKVMKLK